MSLSSRRTPLDEALKQREDKAFERLDLTKVHAGLWLDKYITNCRKNNKTEDDNAPKAVLVQEVSKISIPKEYTAAIRLRKELWTQEMERGLTDFVTLEFDQRVVVGLGQGGVLETGVTLDHTWGTPKIPGSALKGLAAAAAHQLTEDEGWRKGSGHDDKGEAHVILFGDLKSAGVVTFHDALWDPTSPHAPLSADIMTPHHMDYYGGGDAYATDLDSPNPVPFLTASGRFICAVTGPAEWRQVALDLLDLGLKRLGVGAKTAKGYGHGSVNRDEAKKWGDYFKARDSRMSERRALLFGAEGVRGLVECLSGGLKTLQSEHKSLWQPLNLKSPAEQESQERARGVTAPRESDFVPELTFDHLRAEEQDARRWLQGVVGSLERFYALAPDSLWGLIAPRLTSEVEAKNERAYLAIKWREWRIQSDALWTAEMTTLRALYESERTAVVPPTATEVKYSEDEQKVVSEYGSTQAWKQKAKILQDSYQLTRTDQNSDFYKWWKREANAVKGNEKDFKRWFARNPLA